MKRTGRKLFWSDATFDKLSSEDFHADRPIDGCKTEGKLQSDLSASLHIRSSSTQVNRPTPDSPCSSLEQRTDRTSCGHSCVELAQHSSRHRPPGQDQPDIDGAHGPSAGAGSRTATHRQATMDLDTLEPNCAGVATCRDRGGRRFVLCP